MSRKLIGFFCFELCSPGDLGGVGEAESNHRSWKFVLMMQIPMNFAQYSSFPEIKKYIGIEISENKKGSFTLKRTKAKTLIKPFYCNILFRNNCYKTLCCYNTNTIKHQVSRELIKQKLHSLTKTTRRYIQSSKYTTRIISRDFFLSAIFHLKVLERGARRKGKNP